MANRRGFSPQQIADTAYYPEDENRAAERQRLSENNWIDWYNENVSPDAIRKSTFAYAKQNGMSDADAMREANHAASTATRTGYTAEAASMAPVLGAGYNLGREAVNTARAMSGARAAEAVAPKMLALPAPRSGPSSQMGRGTTGEPIPMGKGKLHIDNLIDSAANATTQARQDAAVQKAINEAVKRSRTASPAQMSPEQIANMRRGFFENNPQYVPANARNMGVQEVRAAQDAFQGPPMQQPIVDVSHMFDSPVVSPIQRMQSAPAAAARPAGQLERPMGLSLRNAEATALRNAEAAPAAAPTAAAPRGRDVLNVASDDAALAQRAALDRANAAGPAQTARTSVDAATEADAIAARRQREAQQIADLGGQDAALARQAALDKAAAASAPAREAPIGQIMAGGAIAAGAPIAAMYNVKSDPMYGPLPSNIVGSADFDVPRANRANPSYSPDVEQFHQWLRGEQPQTEQRYSGTETAAMPLVEQRYSGTETAGMPLTPKAAAALAAAKGPAAPVGGKASFNQGRPIDLTSGASSAPTNGPLSSIGNFFRNNYDYNNMSQRQLNDLASGGNKYAEVMAAKKGAEDYRPTDNRDQASSATSEFARGGAAPTKEALLHKSLEIIHHMVRNR